MKTERRAPAAAVRSPAGAATILALTLLASNCGIEVGNPHPKPGTGAGGSGTGALTLALADAPVDDAKHVYLNVVGMRVVPQSAAGVLGTPVTVTLANAGKIDALALQGGKSLDLSAGQALAPGLYGGVILDLDTAEPASIVAGDDTEQTMAFPDSGQGIFVAQGFEVIGGEDLKITLHLDLRRSIRQLQEGGPSRYEFGPVAHMIRQGDGVSVAGSGLPADLASVCAYVKLREDFNNGELGKLHKHSSGGGGAQHPPMPEHPERLALESGGGPHDGHDGPPPDFDGGHAHHGARLPPSFGPSVGDFTPDANATCPNAFASAPIANGAYTFDHLWPGEYHLQFFKADGTPAGVTPQVVNLAPGQHQDLGPPN